jgi:hypothetical protein
MESVMRAIFRAIPFVVGAVFLLAWAHPSFAGAVFSLSATTNHGSKRQITDADLDKIGQTVIAAEVDGIRLTLRNKGPARLIFPVSDHMELDETTSEARSAWQTKSIISD